MAGIRLTTTMRNTRDTKLLFELSESGRRAHRLPACDVPERPVERAAAGRRAGRRAPCPAGAERAAGRAALRESVAAQHERRHALLSARLVHDEVQPEAERARRRACRASPTCIRYQPEETLQGMLQLLYELQEYLQEISGLAACSLQPAAGAHGELTALWVAAAYFRDRGEKRTKVLVPDSAHGTNPASATMAGFETVTVKTLPSGTLDMDDFHRQLDDQIAVFMITNPNTVGIFEPKMREIADAGARARRPGLSRRREHERHPRHRPPRRFRRRHAALQPAQDLQRPARRRRPGAGPICVAEKLAPYLADAGRGEGREVQSSEFRVSDSSPNL